MMMGCLWHAQEGKKHKKKERALAAIAHRWRSISRVHNTMQPGADVNARIRSNKNPDVHDVQMPIYNLDTRYSLISTSFEKCKVLGFLGAYKMRGGRSTSPKRRPSQKTQNVRIVLA